MKELISWTPGADSFSDERGVYRASNKQDSDFLEKNINSKVMVRVFLIPEKFIKWDGRKPWEVPFEEKSWNKKSGEFVPSRYVWKIKNMKKEVTNETVNS